MMASAPKAKRTAVAKPDPAPRIIVAPSVGRPVAVSALARLLPKLHQQPPLHPAEKLLPDDEQGGV